MRSLVAIAALALAGCGGDAAFFGPPPGPAPEPTVSFERVAILGASVSFGMAGGPLDQILEGRVAGASAIANFADLYTFMQPLGRLRAQIDAARAFRPSAVLALDALFWCAYGPGGLEYRRLRLRSCLEELDRIEGPLFVGDLPDMTGATPFMLPASAIPPPAELTALNQEIERWAAAHPEARTVPLSRWNKEMRDKNQVRRFMSPDRLHPNRAGVVYLLRRLAREVDGAGALGRI